MSTQEERDWARAMADREDGAPFPGFSGGVQAHKTSELAKRWDGIATDLHKWSSPLRPSREDTDILRQQVDLWARQRLTDSVEAALLGVTQEVTTNQWIQDMFIHAYDISPGMVARHGIQTTGVRSEVRDWFSLGESSLRFDIVMGDGSFVFYNEERSRQLAHVIDSILTSKGAYIGRHFVLPPIALSPHEVLAAWSEGRFSTLEELKFRMGMALQKTHAEGVYLFQIEERLARHKDGLVKRYGEESVSTLDHYKGSSGKLHFPYWTQIRSWFQSSGYHVRALFPSYTFGECCPTIVATRE